MSGRPSPGVWGPFLFLRATKAPKEKKTGLAVLVGVVRCHEIGLDKRQVVELAHGEQTKGVAYFCASGFDSQIDG